MIDFTGQGAIVTGAGRGLGRYIEYLLTATHSARKSDPIEWAFHRCMQRI